jgi:hypothetical protein
MGSNHESIEILVPDELKPAFRSFRTLSTLGAIALWGSGFTR